MKCTALNYSGTISMLVSKIVTSKLLPQISNIRKSSSVAKQIFRLQCFGKPSKPNEFVDQTSLQRVCELEKAYCRFLIVLLLAKASMIKRTLALSNFERFEIVA